MMTYTIYGKQVTRDEAQRYIQTIPVSPYIGREYHNISYLEGEAEKYFKLLGIKTYSFCGLTLTIKEQTEQGGFNTLQ